MDLRGVEVKKVTWTKAKPDEDGDVQVPPKLALALEISDPNTEDIAELIAFASEGPSTWSIGGVQREMPRD